MRDVSWIIHETHWLFIKFEYAKEIPLASKTIFRNGLKYEWIFFNSSFFIDFSLYSWKTGPRPSTCSLSENYAAFAFVLCTLINVVLYKSSSLRPSSILSIRYVLTHTSSLPYFPPSLPPSFLPSPPSLPSFFPSLRAEGYGNGGPVVCLGDGQTEAEWVPSQGGRGDTLLRRMLPYLTWPVILLLCIC